jgi:hypothetical protein
VPFDRSAFDQTIRFWWTRRLANALCPIIFFVKKQQSYQLSAYEGTSSNRFSCMRTDLHASKHGRREVAILLSDQGSGLVSAVMIELTN